MSSLRRRCDSCQTLIAHDEPLCENCRLGALEFEAGTFGYSVVVGADGCVPCTLVLTLNAHTHVLLGLDVEEVGDLAFRLGHAEEKLTGADQV